MFNQKASNNKDKGTDISFKYDDWDWSPLMDGIVPLPMTTLMAFHLTIADDPVKCLQRMIEVVDGETYEVLWGPEKSAMFKGLWRGQYLD